MIDLSAIRAEMAKDLEIEAKATPGPWHQGSYYKADVNCSGYGECNPVVSCGSATVPQHRHNAAAVTHARNTLRSRCETILALADEIERLRHELRK